MRSKYILRNEGIIINWKGNWANSTDYAWGDVVHVSGVSYYCTAPHVSTYETQPGVGGRWSSYWSVFCQGTQGIPGGTMRWRGAWNSGVQYYTNDGVTYEGRGFYARQNNINSNPPSAPYTENSNWSLFAESGQATNAISPSGWVQIDGETWTYAGADDPAYTFTVSGDKRTKYYPGMRIKLTQTTVKYFIITKVYYSSPNTTITIYGGTDYDLANAAITAPYYSTVKAPAGFPMNPDKWTVQLIDTTVKSQESPAAGVWYNVGGLSLTIPIGNWRVYYFANAQISLSGAQSTTLFTTLSTTTDGASDVHFRLMNYFNALAGFAIPCTREKNLDLSSKTVYYLNLMYGSGTATYLYVDGVDGPTIIKAVCSYL